MITVHGEERQRLITVEGGKTKYRRREKYCVRHDWVDLFMCPDWTEKHGLCAPLTGEQIWNETSDGEKPFADLNPKERFIYNLIADAANEVLEEAGK